jgi:hypothetical protein
MKTEEIKIATGWTGMGAYGITASRNGVSCRLGGCIQPDGSFDAMGGNAWYPEGVRDAELLDAVLAAAKKIKNPAL